MEMSLMQARYEASKAKEETERQADLERQVYHSFVSHKYVGTILV